MYIIHLGGDYGLSTQGFKHHKAILASSHYCILGIWVGYFLCKYIKPIRIKADKVNAGKAYNKKLKMLYPIEAISFKRIITFGTTQEYMNHISNNHRRALASLKVFQSPNTNQRNW